MISKRFSVENDYPLIHNWCLTRKFPSPDPYSLPKFGLLLSDNDTPIVAGFLYKTDGGVAVISNIVSNPYPDKEIRRIAVAQLVMELSELAKDQGYRQITFATNIPSLGDRMAGLGFEKTDENVSHYRRILWQ